MKKYVSRKITKKICSKLDNMPAVAILGPRQCGKTTIAKHIISNIENAVYLDLERRADVNKLRDPEAFFHLNDEKLICLDEIQRTQELFPEIRSKIDRNGNNGQFLILGSSSPELLKQSSETLADRVALIELTPFLINEVYHKSESNILNKLWLRGGFPRSYLAKNDLESFEWREDFIRTFLERDIPQLGIRIPARQLDRFWQMCAHSHGQVLNRSKLGDSLGVSHHTINSYLSILEETFIVRVLMPFYANLKKRLIKSPKIYLRDTGLLHALLGIQTHNDLLGHPEYGSSWESIVIENTLSLNPTWKPFFFRSAAGAEIDLILVKGQRIVAVEIKASTSPEVKKNFWTILEDLNVDDAFIVAPVEEAYPYKNDVKVVPPYQLIL
ncbi:ATPase [Candidatus Magnetomorum sp. HK-1]|nr:ATPase [Candidatus Magnetomorum sp. HK-1]